MEQVKPSFTNYQPRWPLKLKTSFKEEKKHYDCNVFFKSKNAEFFQYFSRCMICPLELSLKANKVKIPKLKIKSPDAEAEPAPT